MTISIIAHDEQTGRVGLAVASKFLAVGARNAFIRTGVGAVASQAFFNPYYGPRGLALLAAGASAEDTVRLLIAADEGRDSRQVHVMDRWGRFAAHPGPVHALVWPSHQVDLLARRQRAGRTAGAGRHGRGLRGGAGRRSRVG